MSHNSDIGGTILMATIYYYNIFEILGIESLHTFQSGEGLTVKSATDKAFTIALRILYQTISDSMTLQYLPADVG